jgi:hypothetical protein
MVPKIDVKNAKGKLIQTYEIFADESATGYGSLITNEHLFKMAKLNAIDDELVSKEQADELTFAVAD